MEDTEDSPKRFTISQAVAKQIIINIGACGKGQDGNGKLPGIENDFQIFAEEDQIQDFSEIQGRQLQRFSFRTLRNPQGQEKVELYNYYWLRIQPSSYDKKLLDMEMATIAWIKQTVAAAGESRTSVTAPEIVRYAQTDSNHCPPHESFGWVLMEYRPEEKYASALTTYSLLDSRMVPKDLSVRQKQMGHIVEQLVDFYGVLADPSLLTEEDRKNGFKDSFGPIWWDEEGGCSKLRVGRPGIDCDKNDPRWKLSSPNTLEWLKMRLETQLRSCKCSIRKKLKQAVHAPTLDGTKGESPMHKRIIEELRVVEARRTSVGMIQQVPVLQHSNIEPCTILVRDHYGLEGEDFEDLERQPELVLVLDWKDAARVPAWKLVAEIPSFISDARNELSKARQEILAEERRSTSTVLASVRAASVNLEALYQVKIKDRLDELSLWPPPARITHHGDENEHGKILDQISWWVILSDLDYLISICSTEEFDGVPDGECEEMDSLEEWLAMVSSSDPKIHADEGYTSLRRLVEPSSVPFDDEKRWTQLRGSRSAWSRLV